ncbi:unnamed protein product [Vitrella brassicaformis CCMP3155]|uniref:Uncharacterized protein n=1 Tax=Vitrella brassicaformis (strain CCMP3155) TaxID=1169540 RepID=A0A0G4F1L2_VITBC|nr:unnamed protein product [Vitrella brassicaformis CCMP3155]|eukprot:CEM05787.1 unnamed protein product [Vitrella brassicaformis CCMP3155]
MAVLLAERRFYRRKARDRPVARSLPCVNRSPVGEPEHLVGQLISRCVWSIRPTHGGDCLSPVTAAELCAVSGGASTSPISSPRLNDLTRVTGRATSQQHPMWRIGNGWHRMINASKEEEGGVSE